MLEARPCPFCGCEAHIYTLLKYGRKVWRVMCGARVNCCILLNDFDSEDEAIHAWNSRRITKAELLSALVVMREKEGYMNASATEYVGNSEPDSRLSGTDNPMSSARISPAVRGSEEADFTRDTRDAEQCAGQIAGGLQGDNEESVDRGGANSL